MQIQLIQSFQRIIASISSMIRCKTCLHSRESTQVCGRLLLMTQIKHLIHHCLLLFLTNQLARPHLHWFIKIIVSSTYMEHLSNLSGLAIRLKFHLKFLNLDLMINTNIVRGKKVFFLQIFRFIDVRDVNATIVMKSENNFMDIYGNNYLTIKI